MIACPRSEACDRVPRRLRHEAGGSDTRPAAAASCSPPFVWIKPHVCTTSTVVDNAQV